MQQPEIITRLESLASDWRASAAAIEDRFAPTNPGQALIAKEALITHAEELDALVDDIRK